MTIALVALRQGDDADALAAQMATGFGGDLNQPKALIAQTERLLTTDPRPDPWGSYLAYDDGTAVGLGAFKSAPDGALAVEIAYMTFPAYEGRGHATAVAGALTDVAIAAGAALVFAHTLPEENASNRALRRNAFDFAGETIDPEDGLVWRWEKRP